EAGAGSGGGGGVSRVRRGVSALVLLTGGWAATLWVAPWSDERVNDLFVYRVFTEPVLDGALPYRDVFLEYPPLAAPAIGLPGLIGTGEEVFRAAYAGWTLLLAAAVVLLCGALAARTGGNPRRALIAAALMPLLCGALVRTHFDLAPVALLLGALLLLVAGRPRSGMAVLGLAAMTKGFPLVAAPVALAWLATRVDRRTLLQSAVALLAALAVPAAAAVAISPGGAWEAVEYHLERPVQLESLPATGVLLLDELGAGEAQSVKSHRSDGLEHPAADALTLLCLGVMLSLIAIAAARAGGTSRQLVLACLIAVAAFATLGKVLSPQYMLWLLPLGALAFAWRLHALAAVTAAAAILTHIEFPARYFDLVDREPFPVAIVAARNLVLLAVLVLALRALRASARQQHLLDRDRPTAPVALDHDRVEPRVLV
ncbi:MAG TPA: glycosyltransferase 87 family protein, partial [Thermoleophilaceae bacterium]|nr:glycosyltransferase 87 family protein [Thermoleophilaceae bacterium]